MRSPEYIEAFVEECLNQGLSKEATASLLVQDSILAQGPEFAAGFTEEVEKSANTGQGFRQLWRATKALGSAGKQIVKGVTSGTTSGVKKFVGPGDSWVSRHPRSAMALGTGIGAGSLAGGYQVANSFQDTPNANFIPPGGYNENSEMSRFYDDLDSRSIGIANLNKDLNIDQGRVAKLQQVVAEGGPGSVSARRELESMLERQRGAKAQQRSYLDAVDRNSRLSDDKIRQAREQLESLSGAEKSFWRLPQRAWLRMTGRNPAEFFDAKRMQAQQELEQNSTASRMLQEQGRRLMNDYRGGSSRPALTPEQARMQFFPQ